MFSVDLWEELRLGNMRPTHNLPTLHWHRECPLLFFQLRLGVSLYHPPTCSFYKFSELQLLQVFTSLVLSLLSVTFLFLPKLGMPPFSEKDLMLIVFVSMTWEFQVPTNKQRCKGSLLPFYFQRQEGSFSHLPSSHPWPEDEDPVIGTVWFYLCI